MGFLDLFSRSPTPATAEEAPQIHAEAGAFLALDDPRLVEFLRAGSSSTAGVTVNVQTAMKNPAVFRSVSLIAQSIGMLPLHLIDKQTKDKARDHTLFKVLHRKPNTWQTAYEFRMLMQLRALVYGDGYARILRSRDVRSNKWKVTGLVPLDPARTTPFQNDDWSVSYRYRQATGGDLILGPDEVFHLRAMSMDGITGMSLVRQAGDAIGLAIAADLALARVFRNGSFVDGVLVTDQEFRDPAAARRLSEMWSARYSGAENAGKTPVLEKGLKYQAVGASPKDAQSHETRGRQVEEIARIFGVPRPLLMVDETSWGSGIEALGQFFVQFGLNPWFESWQQAVERSLLSDEEADRYEVKFNPGALLRGSLKDQADFFSKALGAGGHAPWMHADEVRDSFDLTKRDAPPHTMMGHNGGPPLDENGNTTK